MRLESIAIRNCRSIESARLDGLGQINVLVGRNNAGKSAFFHALNVIAERMAGKQFEWPRTLRNANPQLQLLVDLTFELSDAERRVFFTTVPNQQGYSESVMEALLASAAFRKARFHFGTPIGVPTALNLRETEVLSTDQKWALIHRISGAENIGNPVMRIASLDKLDISGSFDAAAMTLDQGIPSIQQHTSIEDWLLLRASQKSAYFQSSCANYLRRAFFLAASRRSADQLAAHTQEQLLQTGENLPQALLRVHNNLRPQFESIEKFVKAALPETMQLHTPIDGSQTRVGFLLPGVEEIIPLTDMGTGVQHLVMIALILATTGNDAPLFIEEPESSLHPGAQRFLLEALKEDGRQVFMTTHSPVFVTPGSVGAVYRIESRSNQTEARKIEEGVELSSALRSIGARNSDLLLSDAILFVEGESDRVILTTWASALGKPFETRNISILTVGSTEAVKYVSKPRSEILTKISRAAPLPHRFVFDKDERSDDELRALRESLGDRVLVLSRREIENFLLNAETVFARISQRLREQKLPARQQLDATNVRRLILESAQTLKSIVLLKRIRAAMPRLEGGPFPRALATELATCASELDCANSLKRAVKEHHQQWMDTVDIEEIVKREQARSDMDWLSEKTIIENAPGADVLEQVFAAFGLLYDKVIDGRALAQAMGVREIPSELLEVIQWEPDCAPN